MTDLARFCCDVLLGARTEWIYRRKETVDLLDESSLRHRLSLDFSTEDLPSEARGALGIRKVPITLLRKEPGRFTRFDFTDETGRSLPLSTRIENAELSAAILIEAAWRTLSALGTAPTHGLRGELALVAKSEKDLAIAVVTAAYLKPQGSISADADAPLRKALVSDGDFRWLLRTLAYSSVVVADLEENQAKRRVLKLSYDERIEDVTRIRERRLLARIGALGYRLGWRGYVGEFVSPFIGARSYHFELHAPPGMQLLEAGLSGRDPVHDSPRRVHLYEPDACGLRTKLVYAQFRIRGPGFVGAAFLTSLLVTVTMVVALNRVDELRDVSTSAPSLLLLFPGLIASYLARPAHPLVTRLLNLARWTLIGSAGLAYLAAGRLALISPSHPASEQGLSDFFCTASLLAAWCSLVLLGTYRLPLRLSSWPRRGWRKLRKT